MSTSCSSALESFNVINCLSPLATGLCSVLVWTSCVWSEQRRPPLILSLFGPLLVCSLLLVSHSFCLKFDFCHYQLPIYTFFLCLFLLLLSLVHVICLRSSFEPSVVFPVWSGKMILLFVLVNPSFSFSRLVLTRSVSLSFFRFVFWRKQYFYSKSN